MISLDSESNLTYITVVKLGHVQKERQLFLFKDLVICFVQLIVRQMSVSLSYLNIFVPRKFLGEFQIPRTSQNSSDKIMPKGMWSDLADHLLSQELSHAFLDDSSACSR